MSPLAVVAIFVVALAVIFVMSRPGKEVTSTASEGWYVGGEGFEQAKSAQAGGQAILLYFYADW